MNERHEQLLSALADSGGTMTAAELAARLGVSDRSVRSYVTALKARSSPDEIVASSPAGYTLDRAAYARWRERAGAREDLGPGSRVPQLLRRLVDATNGVDVYDIAAEQFVSDSTVEGDLGRARTRLEQTDLSLRRHGSTVTLEGPETAKRRLLGTLIREESSRGMLSLNAIQREFPTARLGEFKSALIAGLEQRGDLLNEYGLSNVLLHIAIAVDRVQRNRSLDGDETAAAPPRDGALSGLLAELIAEHFGIRLGDIDLEYLSYLLATRAVTAGSDEHSDAESDDYLSTTDLEMVRAIVGRAASAYLIELSSEDFLVRLALHVRNLVARAQDRSYSRNPLTRSIKSAYPMIYELAVYIARELQQEKQILINDDEIAYIAMHVGAELEQRRTREDDITVSIVSPTYYELHLALLRRVEETLGREITVVQVSTRTDVDWDALAGDLVISTIEPPVPVQRVVVVRPFFTEQDVETVRGAIARVRKQRRRDNLAQELLVYFEPELFLRNVDAADEEAMIRLLGERLVGVGVIDDSFVTEAIERERMSSTAFTESLAVPHAMAMSAKRTAIAIALNETPMPWGSARVNVVAFIAFSESGRASFQRVFDQFVEVFSERDAVQRLLRKGVDFHSFVDELVRVMDS